MNKKYENLVHTITAKDDPEYCLHFAIGEYAKISYPIWTTSPRGSRIIKFNTIIGIVLDLMRHNELNKKEMLCFYEILEEELKKEGKGWIDQGKCYMIVPSNNNKERR
ncbi:hypothetical protein ES705_29462 [subsurface metagenome]